MLHRTPLALIYTYTHAHTHTHVYALTHIDIHFRDSILMEDGGSSLSDSDLLKPLLSRLGGCKVHGHKKVMLILNT